MAKTKKKMTKEEKLAKDRLRKKLKFAEIKSDPELYRIHQEKEKKRYLEKKEKKKVKSITEMTQREKREQRRRWRKNSINYLKKIKEKKKIQQIILENSPPESENEENYAEQQPVDTNASPDPLATISNSDPTETPSSTMQQCPCKKAIRKLRYQNLKIKQELTKVASENLRLRNSKKQQETKKQEDTLEKKVNNIIQDIKDDKIEQVKRKLLFTESVTKGFIEKYKQSKKKEKSTLANEVLKDKEKMKKYRILSKVPFYIKKKSAECNLGKKTMRSKLQVQSFFEEDVNSQIAAGKNEYIKRGGVKKQKRYLTDNLKNLHEKYCQQNGSISYSSFCNYRPFWVNAPNNKRDTCQCKLHANVELLIKSLKKAQIINEGSATEVLTSLCCDTNNQSCLERSCNSCNRVLHYKEFSDSEKIIYFEWTMEKQKYTAKSGKEMFKNATVKKKQEDRPRHVIKKLENLLNKFLKHHRNIVVQYVAIKELKQNLTANEIICHIDFSENFCLKYHEEVQSFHFGGSRGQVSLHTGVLYYLDQEEKRVSKSFCTMSRCLNHDASAIWAHISPILDMAQKVVPSLTAIHFVSDSPSSQYRNRYIFYMLTKLKDQISTLQEITWSYLEAGHGKGAPDGVGAVVKRTADNFVKYGGDVGSFEDFVKVVQQNIQNVELITIPEEEVAKKRFPAQVPAFKGTTKVHQVIWSCDLAFSLAFRTLSCFTCRSSYIPCEHGKHLGVLSAFSTASNNSTAPRPAHCETFVNSEAGSPLLLDSPTIFNNIGDLIAITELDEAEKPEDTMFIESTKQQPEDQEKVGETFSTSVLTSNASVDKSTSTFYSCEKTQRTANGSNNRITILENIPVNYQRFSVRDGSVGFNSVDQSEFEKYMRRSNENDAVMEHDEDMSNSICQENTDDLKYEVDMWVLVEYKNKNSSQFYVGKITSRSLNTKEYTLIFLRKGRGGLFAWPNVEDDDTVSESYIVQQLENPQETRRGQFRFKNLPAVNIK